MKKRTALITSIFKTVFEVIELAFQEIDVKLRWDSAGVDEIGVCTRTGKIIVRDDHECFEQAIS